MKLIKTIVIISGVILLTLFIAPFIIGRIFNAGNGAGIFASIIILIYGIFFNRINVFICKRKPLLVLICIILSLGIVFSVYATVKITSAFNNPPPKETTVVVLGCQVKPWGPSLMLQERLLAAEKFLKENPNLKCVLSGGQGADEPMSEAEAMFNWLVNKGIDKNRLYLEDKSTSTQENIEFTEKLIEKEGLIPEITIITNEFHQYRAKEIASKNQIESYSVSGKTMLPLFPTFFVREMGGVLFELIKELI